MLPRIALRTAVLMLTLATTGQAQAKKTKKHAASAANPKMITWADLVGDWVGKSMRGKSDSVITKVTTTFHRDSTITVTFPDRKPIPAHLVAMGGDSVVIETDKYPSLTRPGHTTSVRDVLHVGKHKMHGSFRATFDDGTTLDGTTTSTHKR